MAAEKTTAFETVSDAEAAQKLAAGPNGPFCNILDDHNKNEPTVIVHAKPNLIHLQKMFGNLVDDELAKIRQHYQQER